MKKAQLIVAGIGPGSPEDMTPAVIQAVKNSDVVIGYKYYFQFIEPYLEPGTECIDTGMKREKARAEQAFELAEQGKTVCVISSGDAGIYGMAPLVYEMKRERGSRVEIEVLPGISAFQKAASLLGAPIGHDFCVISLSDLMTPWDRIEKRIHAAATADFVTAVYNPKSEGRYWQGRNCDNHHFARIRSRTGGYVYSGIDWQLPVLLSGREINHSAWLLPGKDHRCDRNRSGNYDKQFPYY